MSDINQPNDWMRGLGAVANMKFGPGVLGRIGSVLAVSEVVLGSIAFALAFKDTQACLTVVYMMVGLVAAYLLGGLIYALLQPRAAALDWTQVLLRDVAMKAPPGSQLPSTSPTIIDLTPIQNPQLTDAEAKGAPNA
jgi:hypothetical protein